MPMCASSLTSQHSRETATSRPKPSSWKETHQKNPTKIHKSIPSGKLTWHWKKYPCSIGSASTQSKGPFSIADRYVSWSQNVGIHPRKLTAGYPKWWFFGNGASLKHGGIPGYFWIYQYPWKFFGDSWMFNSSNFWCFLDDFNQPTDQLFHTISSTSFGRPLLQEYHLDLVPRRLPPAPREGGGLQPEIRWENLLRLVVYPVIYRVLAPSQVVVRDFWTIKQYDDYLLDWFWCWIGHKQVSTW